MRHIDIRQYVLDRPKIFVYYNYCIIQLFRVTMTSIRGVYMTEMDNARQLRELVRLLERKLGVLEDGEMSCCGLTMAQCHALVEIGRAGSLSLVSLSELLDLDNSTMSRTVNNLVEKRYGGGGSSTRTTGVM